MAVNLSKFYDDTDGTLASEEALKSLIWLEGQSVQAGPFTPGHLG